MLVYGDPQFSAEPRAVLSWIKSELELADGENLNRLRACLIQTGQFEQAIADGAELGQGIGEADVMAAQGLTDGAARLFLGGLPRLTAEMRVPRLDFERALNETKRALLQLIETYSRRHDLAVPVKVPEGFEFYTLFPEQYRLAALGWLEKNEGTCPKQATVVGVRGIGTSLSALVAEVLRECGWQVLRLTVRPAGAPFSRYVHLPLLVAPLASPVLVVDEGPGLSGSSMAAVAFALEKEGIPLAAISFLPGHAGEVGSAASPEIRRCWAAVVRYTGEVSKLRWRARTGCTESVPALSDNWFAAATERALGRSDEVVRVDDLSAGAWRQFAYSTPAEWPPVAARFERMKMLVRTRSGEMVLWKFQGLGAFLAPGITTAQISVQGREASPSTVHVIAHDQGFVAMRWAEGVRLTRHAAHDPHVLRSVLSYLASSFGPDLPPLEQESSFQRLKQMLLQNVEEALGPAAAKRARQIAGECVPRLPCPTYTDGHFAPHEWVRTASGELIKTDCFGHVTDHTLIGRQPFLWDAAGFLIEWDLESAVLERGFDHFHPRTREFAGLRFYELAYAAFRRGLLSLCSIGEKDPEERRRLDLGMARYRELLEARLA